MLDIKLYCITATLNNTSSVLREYLTESTILFLLFSSVSGMGRQLKFKSKSNPPIYIDSISTGLNSNVSAEMWSANGTATVFSFWLILFRRGSSQPVIRYMCIYFWLSIRQISLQHICNQKIAKWYSPLSPWFVLQFVDLFVWRIISTNGFLGIKCISNYIWSKECHSTNGANSKYHKICVVV